GPSLALRPSAGKLLCDAGNAVLSPAALDPGSIWALGSIWGTGVHKILPEAQIHPGKLVRAGNKGMTGRGRWSRTRRMTAEPAARRRRGVGCGSMPPGLRRVMWVDLGV